MGKSRIERGVRYAALCQIVEFFEFYPRQVSLSRPRMNARKYADGSGIIRRDLSGFAKFGHRLVEHSLCYQNLSELISKVRPRWFHLHRLLGLRYRLVKPPFQVQLICCESLRDHRQRIKFLRFFELG